MPTPFPWRLCVRKATFMSPRVRKVAFLTLPHPLPAAVLWDMDGTLIDSERLWDISLQDTARELGGELSAQSRDALVGVDIDTSIVVLLGDVGMPATPERIGWTYERLVARTEELFTAGDVDWRPGARAALRTVRAAGVLTALVTNSLRRITELALDGIGREFFDVTVCGDEVAEGKPAPDPYRRAAELLGVPAQECVAVEDSPNGALAAERAGAAVLVVPCEVAVPTGPRRTFRDDLVGLTAAELAAVLRAASDADEERVA
jgi:HAD superfamily hydrolase (TIGR01509 family)